MLKIQGREARKVTAEKVTGGYLYSSFINGELYTEFVPSKKRHKVDISKLESVPFFVPADSDNDIMTFVRMVQKNKGAK